MKIIEDPNIVPYTEEIIPFSLLEKQAGNPFLLMISPMKERKEKRTNIIGCNGTYIMHPIIAEKIRELHKDLHSVFYNTWRSPIS